MSRLYMTSCFVLIYDMFFAANGVSYVAKTLAVQHPRVAVQTIQGHASLTGLCQPLCGLIDHLDIPRSDAHRAVFLAAKASLLSRVSALGNRMSALASSSSRKAGAEARREAETRGEDEKLQLKAKLERLLNVSFHYLGLQDLREVPLAVMSTLDQVSPLASWLAIGEVYSEQECARGTRGTRGSDQLLTLVLAQVPPVFLKQLTADKQIFKELPAKYGHVCICCILRSA